MKFAIALIASLFVVAVHCDVPTKKVIDEVYAAYEKKLDQVNDLSKEELKLALIDERIKIAETTVTANLDKWFQLADADDDKDIDKDELLILVWFITAKGDDEYINQAELKQILDKDPEGAEGIFPDDYTDEKLFNQANIIKDTGTDEKLSFAEFQVLIYYHLGESETDDNDTLELPELKEVLTLIGNELLIAQADQLFKDAQTDNNKESLTYLEAAPVILFAIYENNKDEDTTISLDEFKKVVEDLNPAKDAVKIFAKLDTSKDGKLDFKEFKPVLAYLNALEDEILYVYGKHSKTDGKEGLSLDELKAALTELEIPVPENAQEWYNDANTDDNDNLDDDEFLILALFLKAKGADKFINEGELQTVIDSMPTKFPKGQKKEDLFKQGNIIKGDAGLNFEEFRVLIYFHLGDTDNDNDLDKAELKDILAVIGNKRLVTISDTLFDQANVDGDKDNLNYDEAWPLLYFAIQEKANDNDDELDEAEFVNAVTKLNPTLKDKAATQFGTLDASKNGKISFAEFKNGVAWLKGE